MLDNPSPPTSHDDSAGTIKLLRFSAIGCVAAALLIGGIGAYRAAAADVPSFPLGSVMVALLFVGLGIAMFGMAELMLRRDYAVYETSQPQSPAPPINLEFVPQIMSALSNLRVAIQQLPSRIPARAAPEDHPREPRMASDHRVRDIPSPRFDSHSADNIPHGPVQVSAASQPLPPQLTAMFEEMLAILRELRDLSVLNDEQRQERLAIIRKQRRDAAFTEAAYLIEHANWPPAKARVSVLQHDYHDDPELPALLDKLNAGLKHAEELELTALHARVEDLAAIHSFDQAIALATTFIANFPASAQGREILANAQARRDAWIDGEANHLYEQIKSDVERRRWISALQNGRALIAKFPGHRRAASVRGQIQTIQENAEIEQRQSQEHEIQELIRNRKYGDAIELAEDLIARYPQSPQAELLSELLPKLRERMEQEIKESVP